MIFTSDQENINVRTVVTVSKTNLLKGKKKLKPNGVIVTIINLLYGVWRKLLLSFLLP